MLRPVACLAALAAIPAVEMAEALPGRLHLDTVLFADDTEFANERRDGETLLGAQGRAYLRLDPGPAVQLRLGVFAWGRTGTDDGIEDVLPVAALHLVGDGQRFILGTIEPQRADRRPGPDRDAPHGLLPPLREERLAFTDAYESGAQWLAATPRLTSDLWLDWQRANTPDQREAFAAGAVGEIRVAGPLHAAWQADLWHQGGQQHGAGEPVADSLAGGPGLQLRGGDPDGRWAAGEGWLLWASDRPDRAQSDLNQRGRAILVRAEGGIAPLRLHALLWWGDGFNHHAGDANYQARTADGGHRAGFRRYGEAGLSGLWHPAPGVRIAPSARGHLTGGDEIELSVRVVAEVAMDAVRWR